MPVDLRNVVAISCSAYRTVAATQEGCVVCWGDVGDYEYHVNEQDGASVSCGNMFVAALTKGGRAVSWAILAEVPVNPLKICTMKRRLLSAVVALTSWG
jgi:alpha-tubulin suppressor-like RCC1 family protein